MKTYKRIIALALALVMVFAFAGCKQKIDKQVAPEGQNLKLEAVGNWKETTTSNAMTHFNNSTASVIVTWVDAHNNSAEDYIADWKAKSAQEYENMEILEEGTYTLADVEFKTVTWKATVVSMEMKYTYFFAVMNGHLYTVSVGDLESKFDANKDMYYELLDTAYLG